MPAIVRLPRQSRTKFRTSQIRMHGAFTVSWRHFQEERWRIDERGIKDELAVAGSQFKYISADAQSDPQKQLTDIEGLIARGANVLVVLAQDSNAVMPGIERAKAEGIPVIAYDVPIDDPLPSITFGDSWFEKLDGSFALMIVDLRIGDMNGLQIIQRCSQEYPDMEIIMVTGLMVGTAYTIEFFIAWYSANPYEGFAFRNRGTTGLGYQTST